MDTTSNAGSTAGNSPVVRSAGPRDGTSSGVAGSIFRPGILTGDTLVSRGKRGDLVKAKVKDNDKDALLVDQDKNAAPAGGEAPSLDGVQLARADIAAAGPSVAASETGVAVGGAIVGAAAAAETSAMSSGAMTALLGAGVAGTVAAAGGGGGGDAAAGGGGTIIAAKVTTVNSTLVDKAAAIDSAAAAAAAAFAAAAADKAALGAHQALDEATAVRREVFAQAGVTSMDQLKALAAADVAAAQQAGAIAGLTDTEALLVTATAVKATAVIFAKAADLTDAPALRAAADKAAEEADAAILADPGSIDTQKLIEKAEIAADDAQKAEGVDVASGILDGLAVAALGAVAAAAAADMAALGALNKAQESVAAVQLAGRADVVAAAAAAADANAALTDAVALKAAADVAAATAGVTGVADLSAASAVAHHSPLAVAGFDVARDVIDLSAIAHLTDSVGTGLTAGSDFGANNVFIFNGSALSIADAAAAIAKDDSVVATQGFIVINDPAHVNAVTVYHSTNLSANGAETALVSLSGITITALTPANFIV